MRLLYFDGAQKLRLADFSGKPTPPYAILSHRWSNDEVLFEDIKNESYTRKTSYRKIDFCAKQAARDELEYFWIDTCCIDKWNIRELSQAINSMYRWYRSATKCYVFLPDVSVPDDAYICQQDAWEDAFRNSQWHTRGWTLQELIAPVSVEFFSLEGFLLGDKRSLGDLLCAITGIPAKALHGEALESFSIDQRIGWASSRRTTEPEDSAYCLLGILGLSMPPAYGEGREKALARLRVEITSADSVPFSIPFSRNVQFVGRDAELVELEAKVFRDGGPTVFAILRARGIGKTQLALELAYASRERDKNMLVFWIDASDIDSLYQAYERIAQKLNIQGWDAGNADLELLISVRLSREISRRWLLIFDNVESMSAQPIGLGTQPACKMLQHPPQSGLGSILLTTTSNEIATKWARQDTLQVDRMTSDAARRMLGHYLPESIMFDNRQEMMLLLAQLSYLPLAIVQAAAYIRSEGIKLQDYRSLLNQENDGFPEQGNALLRRMPEERFLHDPVTMTLLISLEQLRHTNPVVAETLFIMACVDPKDIPVSLLDALPSHESSKAVAILNDYALVTRRPAESALKVHQLVHDAVRIWLQEHGLLRTWTETAIRHLLEIFPNGEYGNRSKWRRLIAHAKYVLSCDLVEQELEARIDLAERCAGTLLHDGRYMEAEGLLVQVRDTKTLRLGDDHPQTLRCVANLAETYRNQGRWKEAEQLDVKVMERRQTTLGDDHPSTLISIANLASTYRNQGWWKEAEHLDVKVMERSQATLGVNHPDTLMSIANLAATYRNQGRWEEAEHLEVKVMERSQVTLGPDHPSALRSIANLASTYSTQRRWKEAEQLEVKVIGRRQATLGGDHPDTLTSIANLASTYRNQGRCKEAEELQNQAVNSRIQKLGRDHPHTISAIANLEEMHRTGDSLGIRTDELDSKKGDGPGAPTATFPSIMVDIEGKGGARTSKWRRRLKRLL